MKFEQKLCVIAAALVFAVPALATETVSPPVTPPDEPGYTGRASAVGGAAAVIKFALPLIMEYGAQQRIDADVNRALSAAEPRIKEALTISGDKGVLVMARHEKLASGGHGVRGETTRLVGEIGVGDTGAHPILAKLKASSLTPTISAAPKSAVQTTPGYVPDKEFNRMYWAERMPNGKITYRLVDIDKLRKVETLILTNQQMSAAVQQLNYAEDLTSRIRIASVNLEEQAARREAAALLKEREQALKAAEEVDQWLNEELGKAARANQAANTAATVSAAAAAGAAAYGAASSSPSDASNSAKPNNILIKSSTINLRSEDFLKQQRPQPPASRTPGPEVPRL